MWGVASAAEQSTARIARICESAVDARTVRQELLVEIARVVAFDAYAWLLTDPQTWVGSSPLAEVPCLPDLPQLIELKYLTEVNRWANLNPPVARLADCTGGDLSRSLLWRTLLSRYGVIDVASAVFSDQFGCWGFLDLWRSDVTPGPFTAADAAYLSGIVTPITAALRRTQARTFLAPPTREQHPPGPVVLLLSQHLQLLAQTPDTQDYLRVLIPPDTDRSPVPASAYNVAAQLLANEQGIDSNPPSARVHLADGLWLTLEGGQNRGRNDAAGT